MALWDAVACTKSCRCSSTMSMDEMVKYEVDFVVNPKLFFFHKRAGFHLFCNNSDVLVGPQNGW